LASISAYTLPQTSPTYIKLKPAPFTLRPDRKLLAQRTPDSVQ
jgi:hypothetical protein